MIRDKLLIKNVLQMAHDIRSPLFALQVILQTPGDFNENKRNLLLQATERLKQIADGILEENKSSQKVDLNFLVQEIVNEKQITFPNQRIKFNSLKENIICELNPIEMKRIISNLINNSLEAYEAQNGEIEVSLVELDGNIQIIIRDNGKGIPLSLIPKVFSCSYGKENGSGLGLSHAKSYIESTGGTIDITSSNKGTEVCITLKY